MLSRELTFLQGIAAEHESVIDKMVATPADSFESQQQFNLCKVRISLRNIYTGAYAFSVELYYGSVTPGSCI